jgi:nucleotide-binding universal stress UspA family protein
MKLLVAVDDSPWSQAAVSFVQRMAWPTETESIVVCAAAPLPLAYLPDAPPVVTPQQIELHRKNHAAIAERYAARLRDKFQHVRSEVAVADPRDAIVDVAQRERVDLIVVGSHGRTGLKKLLMGSVSSHVVAHAPCSVLVVKLRERKRPAGEVESDADL